MADLDTLGVLAQELALAFVPLAAAFASDAALRDFIEEIGWDFTTPPAALNDVKAPTLAVTAHVQGHELDQSEVLTLLSDLNVAIEAITNLKNATGVSDEFKNTFPRELLDYLIVAHLLEFQPRIGYVLAVFGLIRLEDVAATADRPPYVRRVLALEDVDDFLSHPLDYVKQRYDWGQSDFQGEVLFDALHGLLESWDFNVREQLVPDQTLAQMKAGALSPEDSFDTMLRLVFIEHSLDSTQLEAGVGLFVLPETATQKPGLALLPFTSAGFDADVEIADDLTLTFEAHTDLTGGVSALVRPNEDVQVLAGLESGTPSALSSEVVARLKLGQPGASVVLLGTPGASRLEFGGVSTALGSRAHSSGSFEVFTELGLEAGKIVVKPAAGESDGFLSSLLPENGLTVDMDFRVGFSSTRGLYFVGSGGFELPLPVHIQLGPIEIIGALIAARFGAGSLPVDLAATIRADLSVLRVTVQNVGLTANFTFPDDRKGNLGPVNASLDFKAPNGLGIVVDAGPVTGGGFIAFDPIARRYAGALELSVFSIGVKAFGLVDTVLPDGSSGFSFVIVIVAEFTPIQLGFGFTLLGVGGLVGINRTLSSTGLGDAVRTGSLSHVLFPRDPVADAPAIIHDLGAVFPPAKGHYLLAPLAKLGWGTPTLISADLGIVLEFPGPRIALLGVVRMQLPRPDFAILSLQLAVAGLLDFPAKLFSLDASLFDSYVAGYAVSGDMAYRMGFGDNPAFLLSVGGFNTGFSPPPPFPELRRASVDLGVNGNPSLTCSGYFALTSNTAQIGAKIELRANGYGIRLNGWFGFDVMFVFSPFSFSASISAGIRVSFHGAGIGVTLHGTLSGPTPWHFSGKVCVSILWWDACLPMSVTFGRSEPAALPEIDPWFGTGGVEDQRTKVIGLQEAITTPGNWSGTAPKAGFQVVTLSEAATAGRTPIDPLGAATLRQRVVPLNRPLEKFGEYRPKDHTHFDVTSVQLNDVDLDGDGSADQVPFTVVTDDFAPAHFTELSNAERLSTDSYERMDAGVSIAPDLVRAGDAGSQVLEYETAFITETGETVRDLPGDARFKITQEQLFAMLERSAAARGGIRRSGVNRYRQPLDRPKKVTLQPATFVVVDACSLTPHAGITPVGTTRSRALLALRDHQANNPTDFTRYTIAPVRIAA